MNVNKKITGLYIHNVLCIATFGIGEAVYCQLICRLPINVDSDNL